jgi:metal-responsive CopG/Arc/MetJ family transcriptional regulator
MIAEEMKKKMKKREATKRVLITVPVDLLNKIDALAKKAEMDRGEFICETVKRKFFTDELREAYS